MRRSCGSCGRAAYYHRAARSFICGGCGRSHDRRYAQPGDPGYKPNEPIGLQPIIDTWN